MIKIEVSKEIEQKHKKHFKDNILKSIEESKINPYKYNPILEAQKVNMCSKVFQRKFRKQHNYFMGYIKNNYTDFAIGKLAKLEELEKNIQRLFPIIHKLLNEKSNDSKEDSYNKYMYKLFGYENFKVQELLYYLKKKVKKNAVEKISPAEVRNRIIKVLITNYPRLQEEINNILAPNGNTISAKEFEKNFKKLQRINVSMDNFRQFDIFDDDWSDYSFIMESGIRVCPYCNRQYITPVYSDNGKMRADIDHFLPKSKYPYFSMSLYNLIPVCKSCNQSLKGNKEFGFYSINPYEENLNDYFKFKADTIKNEIEIEIVKDKSGSIRDHIDTFKLETLYNYHNNQVQELVRKRIAYPDSYIKKLYQENEDYFHDENEVKQLIVGYIEDKSRLNDEAFLKLRRDIAEQLGFMNSKQDDSQIEGLKKALVKIKSNL